MPWLALTMLRTTGPWLLFRAFSAGLLLPTPHSVCNQAPYPPLTSLLSRANYPFPLRVLLRPSHSPTQSIIMPLTLPLLSILSRHLPSPYSLSPILSVVTPLVLPHWFYCHTSHPPPYSVCNYAFHYPPFNLLSRPSPSPLFSLLSLLFGVFQCVILFIVFFCIIFVLFFVLSFLFFRFVFFFHLFFVFVLFGFFFVLCFFFCLFFSN